MRRELFETVRKRELDSKYTDAANYILKARGTLNERSLTAEEVNQNERFYTGAFCDGLNAVLFWTTGYLSSTRHVLETKLRIRMYLLAMF